MNQEPASPSPARSSSIATSGLRRFGPLVATLVAIKAVVFGYGAYVGHSTALDTAQYRFNYHHHRTVGRYERPPRFDFFELWVAADAQWYLSIADDGYPSRAQFDPGRPVRGMLEIATNDTQYKYAYFPLWPLVIRAIGALGVRTEVAAFVLANLFSLLGALLLYLLLEPRYGNSVAFGSTVLLQGSPFGLFFCVPFTESLFFLLSVFAALGVERRHGLCAAAGLGLAIVTRSTGVAVSLLVAGWLIRSAQTTPRPRVSPARMLVWSLVAAAPPVAFVTYLQQKIGDPLIVNAVIKGWSGNYGFESPLTNLVQNTWGTFLNFSSLPWHAYNRSQLDFLVLLVSLALLVLGVRRLPPHHVLFAAGVLAIPLLTHDLMSFGRYALVAWPLASVPLLVVAPRYRRWLLWTLLPAMLVGQLGLVARFVNWQWVG